jgi:phosphatidylglycerol---prolipoprotein diacylglyceryl transferase
VNPALGLAFTALGFVVGAHVFHRAAERRGLVTEGMRIVALAGIIGGTIGAKLTQWVLVNGQFLRDNPEALLNPTLGGRTILGGLVVGWMTVEVAKRRLGIRRSTGDLWAQALPAGEAVGRIGCFFNGCCQGAVCTLPWAVYADGAWRHPVQLYFAISAAVIFLIVTRVRDRMPREGDLFRLYLALFGVSRFALEFFRERSAGIGGLSLAQWVSLELVLVGSYALLRAARDRGAARRTSPTAAVG